MRNKKTSTCSQLRAPTDDTVRFVLHVQNSRWGNCWRVSGAAWSPQQMLELMRDVKCNDPFGRQTCSQRHMTNVRDCP
jgi:hypothetical protein